MTGREAEARLARLVVLPANAVDAADIVIPGATEGSAAEGLAAEAPGSTTISLGCAGAWAPSPSVRTWTAVALVTTRGSEPARAFFASAEPGSGPDEGRGHRARDGGHVEVADRRSAEGVGVVVQRVCADDGTVDAAVATLPGPAEPVDQEVVADVVPAASVDVVRVDGPDDLRHLG